ncbi:hypothetical protein [Oceanicola granulosus]|uniref:hypothetical protein n=1 Tax=Oceanicola granulosus TaxID=252302 RepID=UPI001C30DB93|nr:hypothetical protein [Oceanicola granulosus]
MSVIIRGAGGEYDAVAFCPSGSVPLESIEGYARANKGVLFVCKSNRESAEDNVVTQQFFTNYGTAVARCDFMVVFFPHANKVSGPAFEAVAARKPLVVLENRFGKYMKTTFPLSVFFPEEQVPLKPTPGASDAHNSEIISVLRCNLEWETESAIGVAATVRAQGSRKLLEAQDS